MLGRPPALCPSTLCGRAGDRDQGSSIANAVRMGPASACIGIHLPEIAPACGWPVAEAAARNDEAFKQLQAALCSRPQDKAPPWRELFAAVSASEATPWPSKKLLHDTVTLLSQAAEGAGSMLLHWRIGCHW